MDEEILLYKDEEILLYKFNEILGVLDSLEKQNRKIHTDALDIEDFNESKRIMDESFEKIRKVKQWKKELSIIVTDIKSFCKLDKNIVLEKKANEVEKPSQMSLTLDNITGELENFIDKNMKVNVGYKEKEIVSKPINIEEDIDSKEEVGSELDVISEQKNNDSLSGFALLGVEYEVINWKDLICKVCENLINRAPYLCSKLHTIDDFKTMFSEIASNNKAKMKMLSNGLYINLDKDDDELEEIVYRLLKLCGISHEKFRIKV